MGRDRSLGMKLEATGISSGLRISLQPITTMHATCAWASVVHIITMHKIE